MTGIRLDLAFLLNQSAHAFGAHLGAGLLEVGIGVREFCVLMKAAEQERTQNAVAESAGLDKTTMVATLDGLERSGLAERKVSPADRRARVVSVTAKGRRVLDKAYEVYDRVVEESLAGLPAEDRDTFLRVLVTLTETAWASPSHTRSVRRKVPAPAS